MNNCSSRQRPELFSGLEMPKGEPCAIRAWRNRDAHTSRKKWGKACPVSGLGRLGLGNPVAPMKGSPQVRGGTGAKRLPLCGGPCYSGIFPAPSHERMPLPTMDIRFSCWTCFGY